MIRAIVTLALLAALASVSNACPWFRCCRSPKPVIQAEAFPPPVVADDPKPAPEAKKFDPVAVYSMAVRSCVFIVAPTRGGYLQGSGVLIDLDKRLVITTYSAVDTENVVFAQFPVSLKDGSIQTDKNKYIDRVAEGLAIKGKVLFRDSSRDLALVLLEKIPAGTSAISLDQKRAKVGDTVLRIGGHLKTADQIFSFTESTVRTIGFDDVPVLPVAKGVRIKGYSVITSPGTSPIGGALIDRQGNLVGVVEGNVPFAAARNLTFSIDISEVRALLSEKKIVLGTSDMDLRPIPNFDPRPKSKMEVSAEDERAANTLLLRSKVFASGEENRPDYIRKLRQLIEKYPDTVAAKEAKKLLEGLK